MKKWLILVFLMALISCSGTKEEESVSMDSVLTESQMVGVLYDMYLTEAFIRQKEREGQNNIYYTEHYYDLLFEKHQIDTLILKRSYQYYAHKPELLKEMNQKALDSLIVLETNNGSVQE